MGRDHVVEVYEEIRPVARIQQEDEPMNARHPAAWRASKASTLIDGGNLVSAANTEAIADFMRKGGRVLKVPTAIPVTGTEVLDYLLSCGVAAKSCSPISRGAYLCKGKYVSLRKLVDLANRHRLSQQLPLFTVKV